MIYGSVCSGIESATVAWDGLGWKPSFFSEIDKPARAILAHHYPKIACHGDFTTIRKDEYAAIDLLVGGTPCQDFSIAGLRKGITGDRGNLTLEFVKLAARLQPKWIVWENVPGVLSSDGGSAFAAFLGALAKCGYGFAYRVLNAQYYGVPQRRRRMFVVGYFGDWRPPAAVLFDSASLQWNFEARKIKGQEAAKTTGKCLTRRGAGAQNLDTETSNLIIYPINSQMALRGCTSNSPREGLGLGMAGDPAFTLQAQHSHAIAIQGNMIGRSDTAGPQGCGYDQSGLSFTLTNRDIHGVSHKNIVRRLTPIECERLQGIPDNYTFIPYGKRMMPDSQRYKMLGNSKAVPVVRKIGERIELITKLMGDTP